MGVFLALAGVGWGGGRGGGAGALPSARGLGVQDLLGYLPSL